MLPNLRLLSRRCSNLVNRLGPKKFLNNKKISFGVCTNSQQKVIRYNRRWPLKLAHLQTWVLQWHPLKLWRKNKLPKERLKVIFSSNSLRAKKEQVKIRLNSIKIPKICQNKATGIEQGRVLQLQKLKRKDQKQGLLWIRSVTKSGSIQMECQKRRLRKNT